MLARLEWDPSKAAINLRKHGIGFEIAMRVFSDPYALTVQVRIEGGEQRWQTRGIVEGHLLLLVAHATRDDYEDGQPVEVVRIISARRVDRKERRCYEQETR